MASRQPIELLEEFKNYHHMVHSIKPQEADVKIHNSLSIIDALKRDKHVSGIAPRVTARVFYKAGDIDINGIVYGIDVSEEEKLFNFHDYVIKGNSVDLETIDNSIILGKGVAEKMMLEIGDNVEISSAQGHKISLKIVGIFQLGVADIDEVQSYTSLKTSRKILGKESSYVTEIQVKLYDLNEAPDQAEKYKAIFDTDTRDIITSNAEFETGSSVRNIITYSVSVTLLVVAGFGIYNILNMMIYEKMDSIAIMKATGFSGKDVKRIFLCLSLIIGIAGGVAGLILGWIGCLLIDQIPFETISMPTVKTFPIVYSPLYFITGISFAIGTTFIAGYFPARRAGKVDPVVIIRGK